MHIRSFRSRSVSFKNDEGKPIEGAKVTLYGDTQAFEGLWIPDTDFKKESASIAKAAKAGAEIVADVKLQKGKRPRLEAIVAHHREEGILLSTTLIWSRNDDVIVNL